MANLIQNSGFEENSVGTDTPNHWTDQSGNWIVTSDHPNSGDQCFGNEWSGNATGGSGRQAGVWPNTYAYQDISASPETKYTAEVYLYSPSGSGNGDGSGGSSQYVWEDDGRLHIYALDSSGSTLQEWKTIWMGETTDLNANTWNLRSLTFTTPVNTETIRFQIDGGDGNNSVIDAESGHTGNAGLYIDDALLESQSPATPSNLSITSVTSNNIELSWTDNSLTEDYFNIYRSTSSGSVVSDYSKIDTATVNATSYTDSNLSSGSTYYYRVSAENASGESGLSNEISGTTVQTLSGNVTLEGSPTQGATVYIIDDTNGDLEATATTDSNGDYSAEVESGITVHVTVRYDDGSTKYTDKSKPFVTT